MGTKEFLFFAAGMPAAEPPSGNVYHELSCCQVHLASNATCAYRALCIVMSSEELLRHALYLEAVRVYG